MSSSSYTYVIAGAGLAGAAAVEGIRERDPKGSILLVGGEPDPPYDRPPLSKQLWTGAKKVEEIILHPAEFYAEQRVDLSPGTMITDLNPAAHAIKTSRGTEHRYEKLLLATGGTPRRLAIQGGETEGLYYYRTLGDYRRLRSAAVAGKSAAVIGGGFIGSEMAAALRTSQVAVTMIFPDQWLVSRIFPASLGRALTDYYRTARGVTFFTQDQPASIARSGAKFVIRTRAGRELKVDLVVVGIGITPNTGLAQQAGLDTGDGIIVNEYLQSSDPDIYAAGDVAHFPEEILGARRIEHWDNAVSQGKHAGRNMAGAGAPFRELPFFFSDLFEFGYEAVGEIDSRLEVIADWKEPNKTGVLYYLKDGLVRGAMMCNVWGKVDAARELIRSGKKVQPDDLRGAIK